MENSKTISQDMSKFSSIYSIIIAPFPEKFILLGKKPLPTCQSRLIILQVKKNKGKTWERRTSFSFSHQEKVLGSIATGLLYTTPSPFTGGMDAPCASANQDQPLKLWVVTLPPMRAKKVGRTVLKWKRPYR